MNVSSCTGSFPQTMSVWALNIQLWLHITVRSAVKASFSKKLSCQISNIMLQYIRRTGTSSYNYWRTRTYCKWTDCKKHLYLVLPRQPPLPSMPSPSSAIPAVMKEHQKAIYFWNRFSPKQDVLCKQTEANRNTSYAFQEFSFERTIQHTAQPNPEPLHFVSLPLAQMTESSCIVDEPLLKFFDQNHMAIQTHISTSGFGQVVKSGFHNAGTLDIGTLALGNAGQIAKST